MIDFIVREFWLVRFFFYGWSLYELGTLVAVYFLVYRKDRREDTTVSMLLATSCSALALVLVLMLLSWASHFVASLRELLANLVILPIILLTLSTRKLRRFYKQNGVRH